MKTHCFTGIFRPGFFLHTDRKIISIEFYTRDEFYYELMKYKIKYVVMFTSRFLQRAAQYSIPGTRDRRAKSYLTDNTRYEKVYGNNDEKTSVWKVLYNTGFLKACRLGNEGMLNYNRGNPDKAKEKLKAALRIHSDYPSIAGNLAVIYVMEGDYENALKVLNNAIKLYPNSSKLLVLRGNIYDFNGSKEPAQDDWKKALKIARFFNEYKLINDIMNSMDDDLTN